MKKAVALAHGIHGSVVYQRPDGIYKTDIGSSTPVRLAENGTWPRWSPDGRYVAFVRGHRILRVKQDGSGEEALAMAANPRAVAWGPEGLKLFFTDDDIIRAVDLKTRQVQSVTSGYQFRELDSSSSNDLLVTSVRKIGVHIRGYDLATGKQWKIADGCSASLSPDGKRVTNNAGNHRKLFLRDVESGQVTGIVNAPEGHTFDNQFWSNDEDWLVSINDDGDAADVFVHQISKNKAVQVTFTGDCDRPDLFITSYP